jgi:hypothetical protein
LGSSQRHRNGDQHHPRSYRRAGRGGALVVSGSPPSARLLTSPIHFPRYRGGRNIRSPPSARLLTSPIHFPRYRGGKKYPPAPFGSTSPATAGEEFLPRWN